MDTQKYVIVRIFQGLCFTDDVEIKIIVRTTINEGSPFFDFLFANLNVN